MKKSESLYCIHSMNNYDQLLRGDHKEVLDELCERNIAFRTRFDGERLLFSKRKVVKSQKGDGGTKRCKRTTYYLCTALLAQ
jgi:hypothetical protein